MSSINEHPPLIRLFSPRSKPMHVPCGLPEQRGMLIVDATWGTIQPITVAPGVRTVGELEVIAHLQRDLALIDTRAPDSFHAATIPGARNIPHGEIASRIAELDPAQPTILFCNGPQCPATPKAIRALLAAGYPPAAMLYYRGGLHDWVTLGLPLARPVRCHAAVGSRHEPDDDALAARRSAITHAEDAMRLRDHSGEHPAHASTNQP
jgi:rhodanese-related sulfurtransferase